MHEEIAVDKKAKAATKWKTLDPAYIVLVVSVLVALVFAVKLSKQNALLKSALQARASRCKGQSESFT